MNGLSSAEATERLSRVGPNALPDHPPVPLWRRSLRQFQSPLIYILLFALAFDLGVWIDEGAHAWPIEATAIALILLFWMRPLPNAYLHAAVVAGLLIQVGAASLSLTADLLGDAAIPAALWSVVFGGALAWGLAEACARLVWHQHGNEGSGR